MPKKKLKLTATLFNGNVIAGYVTKECNDVAFVTAAFQIYLREKYGIAEDKSFAIIIAADKTKMQQHPYRAPQEWLKVATEAAKQIKWDELPKVFS